MKPLNRNTVPTKNRPIKVLQFGEGNFLRAFVDWMIDILNEKTNFDGDVQIIQPIANGLGDLINSQDGLYHVLSQGIEKGQIIDVSRLVTCVRSVINPYRDYTAFLNQALNPDLQFIISNTTEAGIAFDSNDIEFSEAVPNTFPGKLTALLYQRFLEFGMGVGKGLDIIPCELISSNGDSLKNCVLQYAVLWKLPKEFTNWIEDECSFYNTLVDRIVPGYPKDKINEIQNRIGFEDQLVVKTEPFQLWVIEGSDALQKVFPAEEAGLQVKFVKDQSPYRTRKVRILNGIHTAMVPVAYLQGIRTVREAVKDEKMGAFIQELLFDEIIPTLELNPNELKSFANEVLDRFRNPFIRHELISIALNSISKFKVRVLPSLLMYREKFGTWPKNLCKAFAALLLFYKGEYQGEIIPLQDEVEVLAFFEKVKTETSLEKRVRQILANESLWGQDLSVYPDLVERLIEEMINMEEVGNEN